MYSLHAQPHFYFFFLVLSIAITVPSAYSTPLPLPHAIAAHTLSDPPAAALPHLPRFWNGNADYVERPNEPFGRRSDLSNLDPRAFIPCHEPSCQPLAAGKSNSGTLTVPQETSMNSIKSSLSDFALI